MTDDQTPDVPLRSSDVFLEDLLTRAGDFVPDGSGNLVNAAGYKLMA